MAFVIDAPPAIPATLVTFSLAQGVQALFNQTLDGNTRVTWDVGP